MGDAVTNTTIRETDDHIEIHLTNISDGSGESAITKIDKSTLKVPLTTGVEPTTLDLESVRWAIQGFASVRILWDHDTDDVCMVLSGNGYEDFKGQHTLEKEGEVVKTDPRSTGGTGDIKLTTNGGTSGSTYDITLVFRKTLKT